MINDKPHTGFAHVGGKLSLDFPTPFKAWIAKLAGTTGAEVSVFVVDRAWFQTNEQRKGYHAMLQPMSRETGLSMTALKQYFLGEVFGWEDFKGVRVLVQPSTADLNKKQYSELIERSLDIAVTDFDGFQLEPPSEWTERKRKAREHAARKAAKAA